MVESGCSLTSGRSSPELHGIEIEEDDIWKIWGSVLATRLYWAQPALVKPDYAKP
ncbi:Uncharacterised protein [Neisseria gonorrhoeae]|nr:Uncharacterised protein [Neisseria gonorrhoeae]